MIDRDTARARAEECRKIARRLAKTPIAKENWERLAELWEDELEERREQGQSHNAAGEMGSAKHQQHEF